MLTGAWSKSNLCDRMSLLCKHEGLTIYSPHLHCSLMKDGYCTGHAVCTNSDSDRWIYIVLKLPALSVVWQTCQKFIVVQYQEPETLKNFTDKLQCK